MENAIGIALYGACVWLLTVTVPGWLAEAWDQIAWARRREARRQRREESLREYEAAVESGPLSDIAHAFWRGRWRMLMEDDLGDPLPEHDETWHGTEA